MALPEGQGIAATLLTRGTGSRGSGPGGRPAQAPHRQLESKGAPLCVRGLFLDHCQLSEGVGELQPCPGLPVPLPLGSLGLSFLLQKMEPPGL